MKKLMVGSSLLVALGMFMGVLLVSNFSVDSIGNIFASTKKFGAETPPVQQSEAMKALNSAFTSVSEAVLPSVVSIEVTAEREESDQPSIEDFFDHFRQRGGQEGEDLIQGKGSGVIISKDGYIVTNNHVVENAKDIRVTTFDKRSYKAKLIGTDPLTDLALIKLEGDGDFRPVHFADISSVKVGEWVMAVGNPLGLSSTVTTGIVSAIGRGQLGLSRDRYSVEYYIQTDAAINPGNSGGGLFDMNGSLTGINTAIATSTGNYIGYGFAIPVDLVKSVIDDLIDDGEVNRGYIGVSISSVKDEIEAKAFGLDGVWGVKVESVLKGSAAEEAGLEAGDVILELNGEKLYTSPELQSLVAQKRAGDEINLLIMRNKKKINKTITLKARDEGDNFADASSSEAQPGGSNDPVNFDKLGFKVEKLSDKVKKEYDTDNGVLITDVKRFSIASDRGMYPNGVIIEADRKEVTSTSELKDIIDSKKPGDSFLVKVKYPEVTRILAIQIPEHQG
jgi:serine protease Do